MNSLNLLNVSLVWIAFGQVSVSLLIGITASFLWSRNAARAHRLLSLSIAAAIAMPALSFVVYQIGWGQIVRSEQSAVETVVETSEPTFEKTVVNNHQAGMPAEQAWTADAMQEGAQPATVLLTQPAESVRTGESSTNWVSAILPATWAILSAVLFFRFLTSIVEGRRVLSRAEPISDPAFLQVQLSASSALGLKVAPRLLVSCDVSSPVIWCWGRRPVLLLPKLLGAADDWIGVLCHELAHWKRRDHLWALMPHALTILLPWHPLCWWARRRLESLSEQACDDWALAGGTSPADYAESLLNLLPQNRPQLALAAVRNKKTLVLRLKRILTSRKVNPVAGRKWTYSATAVAMLLVATIALAQVREEAQQKDNAEESTETVQLATDVLAANEDAKKSTTKPTKEFIQVSGVVLKPDGSPAKGATVRAASITGPDLRILLGEDYRAPMTTAKTDDKGRFTIPIHTQPFGDISSLDPNWTTTKKKTQIAASVDGFGPDWVVYEEVDPIKPITLRLVEDTSIQGRVINLEGRPISSTVVKIYGPRPTTNKDHSKQNTITGGRRVSSRLQPRLAGIPEKVTTGNDGAFEINGIGRDRVIWLEFLGESVAFRGVNVTTSKMRPIQKFTFTAAPSRPIEGVVVDAKTRKPLSGVVVRSWKLANSSYAGTRVVKTTTNDKGRFRLTGMHKGNGNRILLLPNDDQPYFMREVDIPDPSGINPVSMTIELHRGIWITGRVTDKITAEPIPGVRMFYFPLLTNKFAQALPEFKDSGNIEGDSLRYHTDADGKYRLVGLPGRAVIGAWSFLKTYRMGVGYKTIDVPKDRRSGKLLTYRKGISPFPEWPSAMREVKAAADVKTVTLNLQLESGASVKLHLVDEAGKPVTGTDINGLSRLFFPATEDPVQTAVNFSPDETRTIVMHHEDRNIGRVIRVGPQQLKIGKVKVTLLPCATVTGKLLSKGEPLSGLEIEPRVLPSVSFGKSLPPVTTDAEGRFTCTLVPGCEYNLHARGKGLDHALVAFELAIEPGETKDLGTLTLGMTRKFVPVTAETTQNSSATSKPKAKPKAEANTTTIRGIVTGPDGQPVQGAAAFSTSTVDRKHPFKRQATTNTKGRFEFRVAAESIDLGKGHVQLVATADGLGLNWVDVSLKEDVPAVSNIQLVPDQVIKGRVLTTEERPVRDAGVRLMGLSEPKGRKLQPLVAAWAQKQKAGESVLIARRLRSSVSQLATITKVDAQGRFAIRGLGQGRLTGIIISGPTVASTRLNVSRYRRA